MGTKNVKNKIRVGHETTVFTSARLRRTLEIAKLAGFEYDQNSKNQWGGFFNVYQLETIEKHLRDYLTLRVEFDKLKLGR